ncbi:MAG TPA: hypothetical protein VNA25_22905 [Phycisphaerae bacterium]|nr:hypothetical protein [Phycisphaerae bacterium]
MIQRFDLDSPDDLSAVLQRTTQFGAQIGAFPRRTVYGRARGLVPVGEAIPDKLVQPADYKEVIAECHADQVFPVYHQRESWGPPGTTWDQNGLNYCWSWGLTATLMDLREREGRPTVQLSPVSLGWLVNWRNAGNYLESAIAGAKERGVCSAAYTPDMHSLRPNRFKDGWEEDAINYRLGEVWDCDPRAMLQHALSVLATGTPLYIAYDWWGHALECVGLRWDEKQVNNVVWIVRNSHGEKDVIELTGNRGLPDEAYGLRASLT